MKRLFSLLALIAIISVSNCSEIPENNDPVLGTWLNTTLAVAEDSKTQNTGEWEEWIFNDVYLGRYHRYSDNQIVLQTDFRWEVVNGVYSLQYSEEELTDVQVILSQSAENEQLELQNGEVFATRR